MCKFTSSDNYTKTRTHLNKPCIEIIFSQIYITSKLSHPAGNVCLRDLVETSGEYCGMIKQ